MTDSEGLRDLTQAYLKASLSEVRSPPSAGFDDDVSFAELGIDSFHVLKIIKKLENDFGRLPKTLLFEYFNLRDLAGYFTVNHGERVMALFNKHIPDGPPYASVGAPPGTAAASTQLAHHLPPETESAVPAKLPILGAATAVFTHPDLGGCVKELYDIYRNEGSVSRGTGNIASNIFIGCDRKGYFNYGRSNDLMLVYAYTGPEAYFPTLCNEMLLHCQAHKLHLNILSDRIIHSVGDVAFTSTPFGALQRIENLNAFTLKGSAMHRLRYMVSKFKKSGVCRTSEHQCGKAPEVDRQIAAVIDDWCASKPMVNPLIHEVKDEIAAGRLGPPHRLFITHVDDVLKNAILITSLSARGTAYLMDLEFYTRDMPLGGLEFAIVNIIGILVSEGCSMLSLGGTYGCRLSESPTADPEVDRILNDLQKQGIFNDAGNLQFKNKFCPTNRSIYLCRGAQDGNADNVVDIIMMIADPARMQTSDEQNYCVPAIAVPGQAIADDTSSIPAVPVVPAASQGTESGTGIALEIDGNLRSKVLAECGFNPLRAPNDAVAFDLKTDSWAQIHSSAIHNRMQNLYGQLHQSIDVEASLRKIFPFAHLVLTASGRSADHLFCKAWARKGEVLQNLLFPTCIFHQIDNGLTPHEVPDEQVFELNSVRIFKGELCLETLQRQVAARPEGIAYVCIELANNAAGGLPISIAHLKAVRTILSEHAIPLVLDCTRILENARFVIDNEPGYSGRTIWDICQEIFGLADAAIGSLAKDFCIDKGGIIATNDTRFFQRIQSLIEEEGSEIDVIGKRLVALALQDRKYIETQVEKRMATVRSIWGALQRQGIPVVYPAGGHCVLIDVKQLPQYDGFEQRLPSFLAWLYLNTGIRAGGHCVGMQKLSPLNELARLAIPIGLRTAQAEEVTHLLLKAFGERRNIPELSRSDANTQDFGDLNGNFVLRRYHHIAESARATGDNPPCLPRTSGRSEGPLPSSVPSAGTAQSHRAAVRGAPLLARRAGDIAIVGMAGRYPKARNLAELWRNLATGRDCIDDMPAFRRKLHTRHQNTDGYRGGFIDDLDKFDSLFFNISPREAEMLDPQERLFLEVAWETLEDAGYNPDPAHPDAAASKVGVFVGAVWAMYQMFGVEERLHGNPVVPNSFLWSIANRVSYVMNWTGPSLTLDTACSSSLTALYLACEALHAGDCSAALVGGVNLDLHQSKYEINLAGGALSKDGVCRSFGKGANGYVAGEGVGALLLKPLEWAVRDRDNIRGVIKGIAVNHGGRTSGYTVPNPKAQTALILSALEKSCVDPRTIGYIEAHGTGTGLGDPIEIAGLASAYRAHGVDDQSCAIGSIKTNIGHLEAAAGIVSVSKVLLQMQHRCLVPSLHSAELNPLIEFEKTPFYVQQHLEAWNPKKQEGTQMPFRAAVSSFGAGGSNAHVVIEGYEADTEHLQQPCDSGPQIVPLSARSEEQLRLSAMRLLDFVAQHLGPPANPPLRLEDLAFTLQNGRKSFDHRMAVVAESSQQLLERLGQYVEGAFDASVMAGHVKGADGLTKLLSRQEKEEFVRLLLVGQDPRKLARLWVEGLLSDLHGLPTSAPAKRVSLPTYPFADKRHWVTDAASPVRAPRMLSVAAHPLVDSNESTFERQLFKKSFSGGDFFIHDHCVAGIPTLPGVAYLELARRAGELAAGRKVRRIRNVLWVSPIAVRNSVAHEAMIELKPAGDSVAFEVFSQGSDGAKTLHSQGKLYYEGAEDAARGPEYVDIAAVRSRCAKVIEGRDAYPLFKSFGLELGPSFQVLGDVCNSDRETLGVLKLPDQRHGELQSLILHPSLVDGSLQAGVAGQLGDEKGEMLVPFTIGEVEICHPLTPDCLSYVTEVNDERSKNSAVSRTNIFILDQSGKILVKINDSVGVPLREVHKNATVRQDEFVRLLYANQWRKLPLPVATNKPSAGGAILWFDCSPSLYDVFVGRPDAAHRRLIRVRPGEAYEEQGPDSYVIDPRNPQDFRNLLVSLKHHGTNVDRICFAWGANSDLRYETPFREDTLASCLELGIYPFLFLCQALIAEQLEGLVKLVYLFVSNPEGSGAHHGAVSAFAKSLQLEHPKSSCTVLEIRQGRFNPETALDIVRLELDHIEPHVASTIRHADGERFMRRLERFRDIDVQRPSSGLGLRHEGVCLITGGAGGLGLVFAEHLARAHHATLVLIGRSAPSEEAVERMEALRRTGTTVHYVRADVSRWEEVQESVESVRKEFGEINGVIHAAGVLRDSYIKNKKPGELRDVLAPKVFGTRFLDEATKSDDLDFFVMFSSLAAVAGNAGQCDYCFANHYMDSFAEEREALRACGARTGKTLSLNWSIWADGGMRLDEQTEKYFRKNLGITPLTRDAGLTAFDNILASDKVQMAVLEGVQKKVEVAWGLVARQQPTEEIRKVSAPVPDGRSANDNEMLDLVKRELSQLVSDFLKLDLADVTEDQILLDLGFDSIGLTAYANAINDKYQLDITPVLFFDHPSIGQIGKYLVAEKRPEVAAFHRAEQGQAATRPTADMTASAAADGGQDLGGQFPGINKASTSVASFSDPVPGESRTGNRFLDQPIAIVGMSGVMPQSDDLDEFWANIESAKSLISIIPGERWNWEKYYGDPLKEPNKSNSKWGGFMNSVDKFDPLFFGISPREAQMMDPQQRIFLETVWKAIEDSGQKVADLSGTRTGLFVGVATNDYIDLMNGLKIDLDGYSASGNSHSVLANRISFLLNLRGPSAPIDTACSSSLVALHRAIESIHTGSSDMAIVGGVQVMLTPAAYISFSMAGMLSEDGKCKSFDKRANGYVRGEGAGAIFLKPLAKAEADGNHIYAVIRATAENHGGRVTTLTAPNSAAQTELLIEAYEKAQIDPSTVGFIECHGTGTPLGDPIEILALKKSFSELYSRHAKLISNTPHCGLSSVKTNVGHLETAAGIAGILKVLLSLKHKKIPANVHFEELNPYISLAGSPFFIADKTTPWEAPIGADGAALPRRAGVSSFGFGGANAHVVLEEHIPTQRRFTKIDLGPQLVVLSAKTEDRLFAYARSLLAFMEKGSPELADLAYTLQVGRDAMNERVAFVASDVELLKSQLRKFIGGGDGETDVFRSPSGKKRNQAPAAGQAGIKAEVAAGLEQRDHRRLARLWVAGSEVDWKLLHMHGSARRISVPTYPFAKERHWVQATAPRVATAEMAENPGQREMRLHSLVHRNVSTLREQKFASSFEGNEFYFDDHRVETQKILPGVAYLEMARVAGELSVGERIRTIEHVVWERPLIIARDRKEVEIVLTSATNGIAFSIQTAGREKALIHCSGILGFGDFAGVPGLVDIDAIRERCPKETISGKDLYPLLNEAGLKLGESFRVVETIHANSTESLAVLRLPDHLRAEADDFWLHPALLDGSLHTAIGLMQANALQIPLSIPYSMEEVQIFRPLTQVRYGYATWSSRDGERGLEDLQIDFQLLDVDGKVLARLKRLASKPFYQAGQRVDLAVQPPGSPPSPERRDGSEHSDVAYYKQVWQEAAMPSTEGAGPALERILIFDHDERVRDEIRQLAGPAKPQCILVKAGDAFRQIGPDVFEIRTGDEDDHALLFRGLADRGWMPEAILHLWSRPDFTTEPLGLDAGLESGFFSTLFAIKTLIRAQEAPGASTSPAQRGQPKCRLIHSHQSTDVQLQPHHAAIGALLKSVAIESGRYLFKTLEFRSQGDLQSTQPAELARCLMNELSGFDASTEEVLYIAGQRRLSRIVPSTLEPARDAAIREGGVYLITGGAGGLGSIFAKWITRQANVHLVLTGRSPPTAEMQLRLADLAATGSEVTYHQVDVANLDEMRHLIKSLNGASKRINGVIHSAGILRDSGIRAKTRSQAHDVLASKLHGTANLDSVTEGEPLDFMVLFSSLTALTGNVGQSDYAYANSFLNHFAAWRNQLAAVGLRSGHTLSINWPLWKEGGMRIDEHIQAFMEQSMGMKALDAHHGLNTFAAALGHKHTQLLVMRGALAKINATLGVAAEPQEGKAMEKRINSGHELIPANPSTNEDEGDHLFQVARKTLLKILAKVLLIPEERLATDADMSEYGLDSIGITNLFSELNAFFGFDLTPATFFEYPTVDALSKFFADEFPDRLRARTAQTPAVPRGDVLRDRTSGSAPSGGRKPGGFRITHSLPAASHAHPEVAIVGVSGAMPQSSNLAEFWSNIAAGRDLITEIPAERWAWRAYDGDPVGERNKTNSKWGGFMRDVDKFDTLFFGITPLEAELMDPQHRIFLETVWHAIQDSGHRPADLAGTKTGVFVGIAGFDYLELLQKNNVDIVAYTATGISHCVLPNRISYLLDIHGPSEPVDTACSSSLVAVHRAVEAISNGSCDMAIAGGVNLLLSPSLYVAFGNAGMLASDGRCKTFDARADGYVRGEGVGAVVLKRLDQALAHGNPIYGVIKASGVNHGGRATSLIAPNPNAQAELLIDVFERGQINPNHVSYIEAHGTGTALGDPVEINGLKKAFKEIYRRRNLAPPQEPHCGLGSVKTSIGHLEMAAGIAGLIKVLLCIKHKTIPANTHYRSMNPHIRLDGSPFYVVKETQSWTPLKDEFGNALPRLAGISSFGFGGANAHVVVQEYLGTSEDSSRSISRSFPPEKAVLLSARTSERLRQTAKELLQHLQDDGGSEEPDLAQIAYTLQVGREAMAERAGFIPGSVEELAAMLQRFIDGEDMISGVYRGSVGSNEAALRIISQDADIRDTIIEKWIAANKLSNLTELWTQGLNFDWRKLYGTTKPPKLLSLPGYPFARDRHWFDAQEPPMPHPSHTTSGTVKLQPLIDTAQFTAGELSYASRFSGNEPFLSNSMVDRGRATIPPAPATLCLEMAEAALEDAATESATQKVELQDIVWAHPLVPSPDTRFRTKLFSSETGLLEFEITSTAANMASTDDQETLHCQGTACVHNETRIPARPIDVEDLKLALRLDMNQQEALFRELERRGMRILGIQQMYCAAGQLLAMLRATNDVAEDALLLRICMIESALLCAGILARGTGSETVPMALGSMSTLRPCEAEMWVWARFSEDIGRNGDGPTLHVDLIDGAGRLAASMRDLIMSPGRKSSAAPAPGGSTPDVWAVKRLEST